MSKFDATHNAVLVSTIALCGILCMAAYLLAFSLGRRCHPRFYQPVIGLGELAKPLLCGMLLGAVILCCRLDGGSSQSTVHSPKSWMLAGVLLSAGFGGLCAGFWAARPRREDVRAGAASLARRLCAAGCLTQDATARVAARLALAAGYDPEGAGALMAAAALHDIGEIGLPDTTLRKAMRPACLDPAEASLFRNHTRIGFRMLAHSHDPMLELAADIALHHHENWDGTGYPHGLAGDHIPLASRAVALAARFDEIMNVPNDIDALIRSIREHAGTRFDPRLVDLLLDDLPGMIAARGGNTQVRGTTRAASMAPRRPAAFRPAGAKPIAV